MDVLSVGDAGRVALACLVDAAAVHALQVAAWITLDLDPRLRLHLAHNGDVHVTSTIKGCSRHRRVALRRENDMLGAGSLVVDRHEELGVGDGRLQAVTGIASYQVWIGIGLLPGQL